MALKYSPQISRNGLVLALDAGDKNSYPGSGTTWYDLSGNGNDFAINASAFNSSGPKYMDFNGSYGCAKKQNSDLVVIGDVTVICWTRVLTSNSNWRTLLRALSTGGDHQVIIQSGGSALGMYDNVNGTGFNSSGFDITTLPGYGTGWAMMTWRWYNNTQPYYNFYYNNTPQTLRGSNNSSNSRFKCGICSIGAYNNSDQNNVNSASQFWGDVSSMTIYNRFLSDNEVLQNYNAQRTRYGV